MPETFVAQEQEVAKKNKNPQLSKSQKRKLKKLEVCACI